MLVKARSMGQPLQPISEKVCADFKAGQDAMGEVSLMQAPAHGCL